MTAYRYVIVINNVWECAFPFPLAKRSTYDGPGSDNPSQHRYAQKGAMTMITTEIKRVRTRHDLYKDKLWGDSRIEDPNKDHDKRHSALFEVLCIIPDHDYQMLKPIFKHLMVHIPDAYHLGEGSTFTERPRVKNMLYLSPMLEMLDDSVILATAAHELAHFVLGHAFFDYSFEKEADQRASEWGFDQDRKPLDTLYLAFETLRHIFQLIQPATEAIDNAAGSDGGDLDLAFETCKQYHAVILHLSEIFPSIVQGMRIREREKMQPVLKDIDQQVKSAETFLVKVIGQHYLSSEATSHD